MNQIVVSQVIHTRGKMTKHQQPLVLFEAKVVFRIIEEIEKGAAGAKLHDDDFPSPLLFFLNGQELDNILKSKMYKNNKNVWAFIWNTRVGLEFFGKVQKTHMDIGVQKCIEAQ